MHNLFRAVWRFVALVAAALLMLVIVNSSALAQTPPAAVPARPVQDPGQQLIDQQREQARQRKLDQAPPTIALPPSAQAPQVAPDTPVVSVSGTR